MTAKQQETPFEVLDEIWNDKETYTDLVHKGDSGWCCIARFLFTYAILSDLNGYFYEDRWCYDSYEKAKAALDAWDGADEPKGWHRHPATGRRVDKDGNEYQYY